MKIFRFDHEGEPRYGALDDTDLVLVEGDIFGEWKKISERVKFDDTVRVLAPVRPSKVLALGLNYRDHALEMGMDIPEEPIIFMKPGTSVIGPGDDILYPGNGVTERVDYEAELGIVIGKAARFVKEADAFGHILGYTCVNDVTARDLQVRDGQWTRAKGFDTFCPAGPCIETELDPSSLKVQAIHNGKVVQDSSTAELIFPVPKIIELLSRVMTLLPGDMIATGTPPGVGPMKPTDKITINVEGVGRLTNQVRMGHIEYEE